MHILHKQTVVAYLGRPFRCGAARNVHILTKTVVVAYLAYRILTFELKVLGLGRDAATGKKLVVRANTGTIVDRNTVLEYVVVADYCVAVDIAKRAYCVVVAYLGFGVDECPIADFIHVA